MKGAKAPPVKKE